LKKNPHLLLHLQEKKKGKHNIYFDLKTQEEKRQTNKGKVLCDRLRITSTFHNKKEGYNKELFEEDNNRINEALYLESQKRQEFLQKNRVPRSFLVCSSSSSSSTPSSSSSLSFPLNFSFSSPLDSSSGSSSVPSDVPSDEEVEFYMRLEK
jgi:hypothetical protein